MERERFSILQLEKDVLEYIESRENYQEHEQKSRSTLHYFQRKFHIQQKKYWYKQYIQNMHFLEKNYRKTNIYTSYHEQLEAPDYPVVEQEEQPPTVTAQLLSPTAPSSAPPFPPEV